ncbi:hypothetical protein HIM_10027 [Hirsutella minnesotensis 3608]|uniref:Uncharacterized protein n=1 Tax=Hirsutella minnesotensis 3608 TaxID=1043627 RepID=A0A0F7ZS20_9HYPO|nr:hypothetical protein HIM_10027 [Hirsutella minnesotensis 3608]
MTRFFKFLFLTGLHLVPAIVILGMAARISVDSDNADQGVFKQSFGLNLFARGLPDPLGEVGAQVGNIGGRLGEQATRLPKDVSNRGQSVAAAGEALILGFSVMALWIITGLLGAADKLQVMVQDMFHVKSTVHKGPLLHDFWMVFGFATCHIFTSIICVYFGIDKRQ